MQADLLIYNAAQVLTVASPEGPKRGEAMDRQVYQETSAILAATGEKPDLENLARGPCESMITNDSLFI